MAGGRAAVTVVGVAVVALFVGCTRFVAAHTGDLLHRKHEPVRERRVRANTRRSGEGRREEKRGKDGGRSVYTHVRLELETLLSIIMN